MTCLTVEEGSRVRTGPTNGEEEEDEVDEAGVLPFEMVRLCTVV